MEVCPLEPYLGVDAEDDPVINENGENPVTLIQMATSKDGVYVIDASSERIEEVHWDEIKCRIMENNDVKKVFFDAGGDVKRLRQKMPTMCKEGGDKDGADRS